MVTFTFRRRHIFAIGLLGVGVFIYAYNSKLLPETEADDEDVLHPWEVKVVVLTFGCSHNVSDGEIMRGVLSQNNFELVDTLEEADCVVINSCTVKNPSQDSAMNLVKEAQKAGKAVVVGGCVPQAERSMQWLSEASLVGVEHLEELPDIVISAMQGVRTVALSAKRGGDKGSYYLELPKRRRKELVEILVINQGCLGKCTYCKTRFARGVLRSYDASAILNRARESLDNGVTQLWLTSEDLGAYGLDRESEPGVGDEQLSLSGLCEALICLIKSHPRGVWPQSQLPRVMLRLGMTNPPFILNQLDRLADVLKSPFVFKHIHIPVQSGSDAVLGRMIRDYTVKDFETCSEALEIAGCRIATDVICGFPGETDDDHNETMDLISRRNFAVLNISQYFARPGTVAASMKQIDKKISKRRTKDVSILFESYSTHSELKGTRQLVYFTEASDRSHHVVGHTVQYVKVLVDGKLEELMGKTAWVNVTETTKWHIVGEIEIILV